ncbi:hypothetical protein ABFS83_02G036500 [Erythranthe nasuta]
MLIHSNVWLALLLLLAIFLFHATCLNTNQLAHPIIANGREALEIIIGGGGSGSYGSPPAPPPSYYPFESTRIEIVYPVIQKFKQKITSDPYNITNTWVGPDICNNYKGFFCDTLLGDYNSVALAGVTFNGFNFDGPDLTLAGFIDELPDIIVFHANSNNFKGSFPTNISKIKYLYELDLSNNKYTCEFPHEILGSQLTFLDLRYNAFSSVVPPQVFTLDVDVLFINNNNFMQRLPDNLGSTPALYVTLANNRFTGPIPTSIGQAGKTLIEIILLNNGLSGCLSCEIGLLEKATVFDASRNYLTGRIPLSFTCLGMIEILDLADNQLYGHVPELVCELPNLVTLSLSYNYFTGIGPKCLELVEKNVLHLRMNCIPGLPDQRTRAQCHAFFSTAKWCPKSNWIPCSSGGVIRRNSLESSLDTNGTSAVSVKSKSRAYAALNRRL